MPGSLFLPTLLILHPALLLLCLPRVEVSQHPDIILNNATIKQLIGDKCDGVIGQLTEVRKRGAWGGMHGMHVV